MKEKWKNRYLSTHRRGGGMSELIGKITLPWMPELLINQRYKASDRRYGKTAALNDAMRAIVLMLRPAIGYSWKWDEKRRIDVTITLFNHASADPDGLSKSIDDAIKVAIRVDDLKFDTHAIGKSDGGETRIEVELKYGGEE